MHSSLTNSTLHYTLIKYIIDKGFAPSIEDLIQIFDTDKESVIKGLHDLEEYHGVVLHPHLPKVWVIHPFSLAPTNFYVKSGKGEWWGNCAWCSLGIAALVSGDVQIISRIGAETKPVSYTHLDVYKRQH